MRLLAAELVDLPARALVHVAAARVDVVRDLVDRLLARLELVAVVGFARLGEPGAQLVGGIGRGRLRTPPPPGEAEQSGQGGEEASHVRDATVAVASCPVNVSFRPERHRQSGPIQTVGSLTAKEVIGTLTTYEVLIMLDPEGAESHQDDLIARVRDLVEKGGGTWRSHDAWGRRRLAYPISKKPEGVYHLVVFESNAETLDEIARVLKIDDAVMRHLATKHVEGSRTSAPRDETPAPAPVAVPEYEAPPTEPDEEE
jgi:small subunit ribosomal protein S6